MVIKLDQWSFERAVRVQAHRLKQRESGQKYNCDICLDLGCTLHQQDRTMALCDCSAGKQLRKAIQPVKMENSKCY
jgi:predicted nucleic acid binding AN1-type Zn finger protein